MGIRHLQDQLIHHLPTSRPPLLGVHLKTSSTRPCALLEVHDRICLLSAPAGEYTPLNFPIRVTFCRSPTHVFHRIRNELDHAAQGGQPRRRPGTVAALPPAAAGAGPETTARRPLAGRG